MGSVINRPAVLHLFAAQHWVASHRAAPRARRVPPAPSNEPRRRADPDDAWSPASSGSPGTPGDVRARGDGPAAARRTGRRSSAAPAPACSTVCARCPARIVEVHGPRGPSSVDAAVGPPGTHELDRRRSATSMVRDDGLRVATPLRMLFRLALGLQRAPLRASGRGRLAPRARHARRRRRLPGRGAPQRQGRRHPVRELAGARPSLRVRPSQSGLELDVIDAIRRRGTAGARAAAPADPAHAAR